MTGNEFDTGMALIYSRWGQKSYPEQLRTRIYYHCQRLPYKSFERIILTLMDTARNAPMPNEFRILAHAEMDRLGLKGDGEPMTKPSHEAKCMDCGDSGNLHVVRNDQYEPWARMAHGTCRCHCEVGSRRPRSQGGQWTHQWASSYTKQPAHQSGQGDWRPKPEMKVMEMVDFLRSVPSETKEQLRRRTSSLKPAAEILPDLPPDDGPGAA